MLLGNSESYIDIEAVDPIEASDNSIRFTVQIVGSGVNHEQSDVWFSKETVEEFIDQLFAMVREERNDATLGNRNDTADLTLKITRPIKSHLMLEGKLRRSNPEATATISSSVIFSIFMDADNLFSLAELFSEAWKVPATHLSLSH